VPTAQRRSGPIVFRANEATCLYLLPDIFAEFQRRYPLVHISIYRNFSHKIMQRVEDGPWMSASCPPHQSPNLKMTTFTRIACASWSARKTLGSSLQDHPRRSRRAPLIFPRTGFTRQVLDKLFAPIARASTSPWNCPASAYDQALSWPPMPASPSSAKFAKDYVKAGEVKLLTVEASTSGANSASSTAATEPPPRRPSAQSA